MSNELELQLVEVKPEKTNEEKLREMLEKTILLEKSIQEKKKLQTG